MAEHNNMSAITLFYICFICYNWINSPSLYEWKILQCDVHPKHKRTNKQHLRSYTTGRGCWWLEQVLMEMDEFAPPKPCSNDNKKFTKLKLHKILNYYVGYIILFLTEYWHMLFVCCLKTYQQYSSLVTAVALAYTQRVYKLRST